METRKVQRDENGESQALKSARSAAQTAVQNPEVGKWERYVREAKQLYNLDEAQSSTADSILRECIERSRAISGNEPWKARLFANRLWTQMSWLIPGGGWNSPLRTLLDAQHREMVGPLTAMGDELMKRIDGIPTTAQRQQAERGVDELLRAMGFEEPSPDKVAQRP
jgi:hypothetical protein